MLRRRIRVLGGWEGPKSLTPGLVPSQMASIGRFAQKWLSGVQSTPRRVSGLTRIYASRYIMRPVATTFDVIVEPNRRAILSLLAGSERSVGEIERQLRLPQTSVSKHLRVLRNAGFVESRVAAQRRLYRLRLEPLREVDDWLEPFRRLWSGHVDALERHLDRKHGDS